MYTHGSFSTKTCRASSLTPKKGIAFPLASLPPKPAPAHDGHVIGMVGLVALPGYAKKTKQNKNKKNETKKPKCIDNNNNNNNKTEKVFTLDFGRVCIRIKILPYLFD